MAAYAALNTLMYILQQIQNHPCPPITLEKQHIDSLSEIICFLQDFLENYSHRDIGDGKEALERQIANAVYAAEDVIETHIVDQILAKSKENNFTHLFGRGAKKMIRTLACFTSHITDHQIPTVDRETSSNSIFCQDLQKVIEDMYLIKKEVIEIQEKIVGINDDQPPRPIISVYANLSGSSAVPPPKRKNSNTMVGFDEVLNQIMDRLTGHPPNRQVLPIVGMGGIDHLSAPLEIWEMSQLRYLVNNGLSMPDPPNVPLIHDGDDDYFILRNLHTIKTVINFKLSEEVIKRIPNIKKLGLFYDVMCDEEWWHSYCLNNLGLLNKLESLSIRLLGGELNLQIDFALPHSLKKLSLDHTKLLCEDTRMIGSLPHLQVLKLSVCSFPGPEWNPVEGEFLCLKFLEIYYCADLVYWNANRTHFPCLEKLVLHFLAELKKIPRDIGHISTLESIELRHCSDSAVMSAKKLLDEQVELGNEDLHVHVTCRKNNQLESLRSHNFQVQSFY